MPVMTTGRGICVHIICLPPVADVNGMRVLHDADSACLLPAVSCPGARSISRWHEVAVPRQNSAVIASMLAVMAAETARGEYMCP